MKGTFKCVVIDHVLRESKEKKTPSVMLKLDTVENIITGEKVQSTHLYFDGYLTENAIDNTMKTLTEALGWNGVDLNDLNGTGKFCGVEVAAVVDEESYQGQLRSKVKFVNNLERATAKIDPMESGIARGLAESLKGRIMKYRQDNKGETRPPVSTPPSSQPPDKDLPF